MSQEREEKEALVARLIELVQEADGDLSSEGLIEADPKAFKRARMLFGSWEEALVATLVQACQGSRRRKLTKRAVTVEEDHQRTAAEGWDGPVVLFTDQRRCCVINGDSLETFRSGVIKPQPLLLGDQPATLTMAVANPNEDVLVVISDRGLLYPLDARVIPHASAPTTRTVADVTGMASDEHVVAVMPRLWLLGADRFVHATTQGRIKGSASRDFGRMQDRDGTVAFLLAPEDRVCGAFAQRPEHGAIFCANAQGNGIHFKTKDIRTMGLRAQGVKSMTLGDDGDEVIGALPVSGEEQIVVLSAGGQGKRVPLSQFRIQGRAGQGMILMRPGGSDRLASLVAVDGPDDDLLVWTAQGNVARLAASAIPLLDRSARGQSLVALEGGDQIVGACRLPGSG